MSEPRVREQVARLRRAGAWGPITVAASMLAGVTVALLHGESTWSFWLVWFGIVAWAGTAIHRDAHRRDRVVLRSDDAAVRTYLAGRLQTTMRRMARNELVFAGIGVLLLLLGLVYLTTTRDYPARPGVGWPPALCGAALLLTHLHRRLLLRPSLARQRAALGDGVAPKPTDPWVVVCARAIAAEQDERQSALFWYELAGVGYGAARAVVHAILADPGPPTTSSAAPPPPPEQLRARIRRLLVRDLIISAVFLAMLASLVALECWGHGVHWGELAHLPWEGLTTFQQVAVAVAGLALLGAVVEAAQHRTALRGDAGAMRGYLKRRYEAGLKQIGRRSFLVLALALFSVVLLGHGVVVTVRASEPAARVLGLSQIAEGCILCLWYGVLPRAGKQKALTRLRLALSGLCPEPAPVDGPPPS